jgi:hypothetical protein
METRIQSRPVSLKGVAIIQRCHGRKEQLAALRENSISRVKKKRQRWSLLDDAPLGRVNLVADMHELSAKMIKLVLVVAANINE